ncbi:MAG: GatB/YqeY domain-containing protein [Bacillota bacterium]|nr:MAG: aspartyl-tRNA amidotransferase [Bacillota bacterium]
MNLNERLTEDMKAALKAGPAGKLRLETIRFLRAAIKNAEIEKHAPLSDDEILGIITKQVKQLRESLADFQRSNRQDLVEKTEAEIAILSEYLPKQLSADEVRDLARTVIAQVGAQGPKDMGKVMGPLMAQVRGRADGKMVQQIVKELLG